MLVGLAATEVDVAVGVGAADVGDGKELVLVAGGVGVGGIAVAVGGMALGVGEGTLFVLVEVGGSIVAVGMGVPLVDDGEGAGGVAPSRWSASDGTQLLSPMPPKRVPGWPSPLSSERERPAPFDI